MEKPIEPGSIDPHEFMLPETLFSRDINNSVLQGIVEKTLSRFPEISLRGETFLDQVVGRTEKYRGISTTQDPLSQSIKVSIELFVMYGTNIPQKAHEIQSAIAEDLTAITGLHVSEVHLLFKDLMQNPPAHASSIPRTMETIIHEEFENDF